MNPSRERDPEAFAREALAALDANRQIVPFTDIAPGYDFAAGRLAAAAFSRLRTGRGETPVGRKIGFTNRNIWDEYGVHAPIWGHVYETTLLAVSPGDAADVSMLPEPRIEPEIVLCLDRAPYAGMTLNEVAGCIGWIAHGFEIVQSVFPGWRFKAADCMASGGLHGRLLLGPRVPVAPQDRGSLPDRLSAICVTLSCNGTVMDAGSGANVLDGPVHALKQFVEALSAMDDGSPPLASGEMVSTGTLTRAFPVSAGETWETFIDGVDLPGLRVQF